MVEFDHATQPWVDRDSFAQEAAARQAAGRLADTGRARLEAWRREGFVALRGAVAPDLVARLLADYERAWHQRPPLRVLVEGRGEQAFPEVAPRDTLSHHHYRVMDFHEISEAGRQIVFHDAITSTLAEIFDAPPVAMQSLLFEYGSEQRIHQDFPYVQARIPSHLIGCWVALEDVDEGNGPLFYLPGSHRLPLFDWGAGNLVYDGGDDQRVTAFEAHLERICAEAGLVRTVLTARQGDVLLWHAALAHGGSPVRDPARSRKSFVIHYSTREAYPRDRRWPDREPRVEAVGGGLRYYEPQMPRPGLLRRAWSKLGRRFT